MTSIGRKVDGTRLCVGARIWTEDVTENLALRDPYGRNQGEEDDRARQDHHGEGVGDADSSDTRLILL